MSKVGITITFSESVENHIGMEKIGQKASDGFSLNDLVQAKNNLEKMGITCELVTLIPPEKSVTPGYVLIARKAVDNCADSLLIELQKFSWDTMIYSAKHGRVVNKHARYNVCFGDVAQTADIPNKKGTIIPFSQTPILNNIRQSLPLWLGNKAYQLLAEGNNYYDVTKCGIGPHGDTERKLVVGVRLGASFPLCYQWYYKGVRTGPRIDIHLNHGDIYVMSDKAVGHDWKKSSIFTLRHSAGAEKYIK